ncbi:hypothetical protein SAY87_000251 [Trapa incisa]|uniref:Uncharacterized protein n=1 Tax=Trapa incisa TaxID=236973 RepID=A0AAN7GBF3_9MYRT|nr:hypothetical protein SAY87_000251 [Trapa incisa]
MATGYGSMKGVWVAHEKMEGLTLAYWVYLCIYLYEGCCRQSHLEEDKVASVVRPKGSHFFLERATSKLVQTSGSLSVCAVEALVDLFRLVDRVAEPRNQTGYVICRTMQELIERYTSYSSQSGPAPAASAHVASQQRPSPSSSSSIGEDAAASNFLQVSTSNPSYINYAHPLTDTMLQNGGRPLPQEAEIAVKKVVERERGRERMDATKILSASMASWLHQKIQHRDEVETGPPSYQACPHPVAIASLIMDAGVHYWVLKCIEIRFIQVSSSHDLVEYTTFYTCKKYDQVTGGSFLNSGTAP